MQLFLPGLIGMLWSASLFGQVDSTAAKEERIPFMAEQMPEYIGGYEALARYLNTYAVYTMDAREAGVSGVVFLSFTVERDGTLNEVKVLRRLHRDLDSIAAKAVREMPPWLPAMRRGKPVAVQYNLPVKFSLENGDPLRMPEPSKYWENRGKRLFYKSCKEEFGYSGDECDCWYRFVVFNYNTRHFHELNLGEMFEKHTCK
ncbi:MAG: energy transducer TonB [Flavobacteriales bacterium]|nr:energy transducer TonB [Flavobacteriales bacterium]